MTVFSDILKSIFNKTANTPILPFAKSTTPANIHKTMSNVGQKLQQVNLPTINLPEKPFAPSFMGSNLPGRNTISNLLKGSFPILQVPEQINTTAQFYGKALQPEKYPLESGLTMIPYLGSVKRVPNAILKDVTKMSQWKKINAELENIPVVGEKVRKTVSNMLKSKNVAPTIKKAVKKVATPYAVRPQVPFLANAEKLFKNPNTAQQTLDALETYLKDPKSMLTDDVTAQLSHAFNYLSKKGRQEAIENLFTTYSQKATTQGQGISMIRAFYKTTPEVKIRMIINSMAKALQEKGIKIPQQQQLLSTMKTALGKALKMKDVGEQEKAVTQLFDGLQQKLPPTWGELLTDFRYNNMLSSPATASKNILSNIFQTYVMRPATIAGREGIGNMLKYYKGTKEAMKGGLRSRAWQAGAKSFLNPMVEFGKEVSPSNVGQLLKGKNYNWWQKIALQNRIPIRMMESPDQFFRTIIREGELATGKTMQEADRIAEQVLFRAPYDVINKTGQGIWTSKIDSIVRGIDSFLQKNNLKFLQPFVRTPYNVAKESYKYSPLGFTKLVEPGVADRKLSAVQAGIGTLVSGIGALAAANGQTTWSVPEDKTLREQMYGANVKPYSVQIWKNGPQIPFAMLGSLGIAMAIPAAINHYVSQDPDAVKNKGFDKVVKTLGGLTGYILQMTPMSQTFGLLDTIFSDKEEKWNLLAKQGAFLSGQMIWAKGALQYLTRVLDDSYRKSWDSSPVQQFINVLKRDLPLLSKQLPAYENVLGEEEKRPPAWYLTGYEITSPRQDLLPLYENRIKEMQTDRAYGNIETMTEAGASPEEIAKELQRVDSLVGKQGMPTTEGMVQPKAIGISINDILAKKLEQDKKEQQMDKIIKLPISYEQKVQSLQAQGFTPQEIDFRIAGKLDAEKERPSVLLDWVEKGKYTMTQLYEQDILTPSVIKQWEREGKIQDADSLIDKLKMTDVYEQKKSMRAFQSKRVSNQIRTIKKMFSNLKTARVKTMTIRDKYNKKRSDIKKQSVKRMLAQMNKLASQKPTVISKKKIKARYKVPKFRLT